MGPLNLPRWLLLGLAIVMVALTARGLFTGEMKRAGVPHRRDEAPRDYWFEVATSLAVAFPVLFLVLLLPRRPDGHEGHLFFYLLPLFMLQGLAQALWYRRAPFFFRDYSRAETPRAYAAVVGVEILFIVVFVALALWFRGSGA